MLHLRKYYILQLFDGGDFKEKQESFDKVMESIETNNDKHMQTAIQRFFYLIGAWYGGQANKIEDFKKLEDLLI